MRTERGRWSSSETADWSEVKKFAQKGGSVAVFKRLGYILERCGLFETYRRELLEKARERNLSLVMIEKVPSLVFEGGTALSKIYFAETWRLSEDLDLSLIEGEWADLKRPLPGLLKALAKECGIDFRLANVFGNPGYLQLKIQYTGPIGRNWIKVDIRKDDLVDTPEKKTVARSYSDYPDFTLRVESLAEICAAKIRTLIERRKCRDYFGLWKLLGRPPRNCLDEVGTKGVASRSPRTNSSPCP